MDIFILRSGFLMKNLFIILFYYWNSIFILFVLYFINYFFEMNIMLYKMYFCDSYNFNIFIIKYFIFMMFVEI